MVESLYIPGPCVTQFLEFNSFMSGTDQRHKRYFQLGQVINYSNEHHLPMICVIISIQMPMDSHRSQYFLGVSSPPSFKLARTSHTTSARSPALRFLQLPPTWAAAHSELLLSPATGASTSVMWGATACKNGD